MAETPSEAGYYVWGIDCAAYGPVELPALISWVKDERVTAETWVYSLRESAWQKAPQWTELQMFFHKKAAPASSGTKPAISTGALRRVKILGAMTDEQLDRFSSFVEVLKVAQWAVVVKQGERGDAMFFILEGELRVRINVTDRETVLATMGPGDFFGDISLFDQGPRSADVVANMDSLLVKVSVAAFDKVAKEAPDLATPFLLAIGKTLTARIRADNKRFGDSVKFARAAK